MNLPLRVAIIATVLACLALAIASVTYWHLRAEEAGCLSGIPESIEVGELLSSGTISDLREGCGAAVFQISGSTLAAIQAQGLSFFQDARLGRDNGKYFRYGEWQRTPAVSTDRVLRGLGCAKLESNLAASIERAATGVGSYFAIGYEYDLMLIPSEGLIVLTFNG